MSTREFDCPECNAPITVPPVAAPGEAVRCPSCGSTVRVPEGGFIAGSPPPAARRPREGITDAPTYPEGAADDFDRPDGPWAGLGLEGLSNDYSIRVGDWFRYAQAHWSAVVGPMIGYLFVYLLIVFGLVITCVGILALPFLLPPLAAGFTIVGLAQLKGERWTFGDFFGGFRQFWPLVGGVWLTVLVAGLWPIPGTVLETIGEAKYQAAANANVQARPPFNPNAPFAQPVVGVQPQGAHLDDPLVAAGLVLRLIGQLVGIYFQIRCMFVLPLIVDRKCGAVESVQGSFLVTKGHFWGLLGVALLLGLIAIGGLLLCIVGVLLVFPLIQLVTLAGYLLIAGTRPPVGTPRTEPAS
jgi:hypothetical protein